jgi:CRP-like cAMP-binding protein
MEPWLISPTSTVKAAWDVWILLLLVFLLLFLPIRLAFEPAGYEALKVGTTHMVDLFIDVCFLADIFVNFFTAYQNRFGHIVTDRSKIASRYVKSWFLLDVVSTFPFHMVIDDRSANIASLAKVPRLLKLIRLLRFLRLLKAYRFKQLMEAVEYSRHVHPSVFRIFKLLAYVLVFAHVGACFWYFLGEMQETEEAWIHRHWNDGPSISDESGMTKYITSMYWLLTTLTTIGYGDITPRTDSEMWFANLIMIMGTIFFAYTTASVSSILVTTDNDNSGLREKMSELRVFIRGFKLSPGLSKMLTQHMKTKWEKPTINSKQDWTELMRAMPPRIRTRVVKYVYSDLIKRSPLFSAYSQKGCGEQFLIDIFHNLHPMQRTKGDVVVSRDEPFTEWYIVQEGKVNAVSSHDHSFVYMHFKDGMSFGEIPLFLDRDAWEYTAIVDSKICFLLSIDANVLQRLFVKDYHTAKNRRLPTTAFVEKLVASTSRRLVALKRAKQARLTARTAREPRSRWTRDKSIIGTLKLRDAQIKVPDIHVMDLMTDTTGKKSKQLMLTMYKELKSMSASMKSMQSQIQQLAVSNAKLSSFKAQHETKIEQKSPRKKLRERPPARGSILRDAPLRISGVTDLDSDDDPNEARSPSPPMYGDEDR